MMRKVAPAVTALCAGLLWTSCNTCPFELVERIGDTATLDPGGSYRFDITVQDVDDLEVDVASTAFPGVTGRVDIWLTEVSCDALFAGDYPSSAPRCTSLIGPVAPGAVSERRKVRPGRYRVFAQAYTSNAAPARFDYDVGVWGRPCHTGYVGP
jgi:hypothetical protein